MRREKQNTGRSSDRNGKHRFKWHSNCSNFSWDTSRYAGGTSEEFCRVYRNTLARDGGKEKERVEQNIKTFLRQRKKHQRDMNNV